MFSNGLRAIRFYRCSLFSFFSTIDELWDDDQLLVLPEWQVEEIVGESEA